MPNWNTNRLTIEGPEQIRNEFVEKAKGPDQRYGPQNYELKAACQALEVDFEDELQRARAKTLLEQNDPRLASVIEQFNMERGAEEEHVLSFHQLYPVPDDVLESAYDPVGYAWEGDNWGCKWGCSDPQLVNHDGDSTVYEFQTPWAPPLNFLDKVSGDYPDLTFTLRYVEPGMAFGGEAEFNNGERVRDESWDFGKDDCDYFGWEWDDFTPEDEDEDDAEEQRRDEKNGLYGEHVDDCN